jgi:hypothetical protein
MPVADTLEPAVELLTTMGQLLGKLLGNDPQTEIDSAVLALDILADQANDGHRLGPEFQLLAAPPVCQDIDQRGSHQNIDAHDADDEVTDETRIRLPVKPPRTRSWDGLGGRGGRAALSHLSAVISRSGLAPDGTSHCRGWRPERLSRGELVSCRGLAYGQRIKKTIPEHSDAVLSLATVLRAAAERSRRWPQRWPTNAAVTSATLSDRVQDQHGDDRKSAERC